MIVIIDIVIISDIMIIIIKALFVFIINKIIIVNIVTISAILQQLQLCNSITMFIAHT